MNVDSNILDASYQSPFLSMVSMTGAGTGGTGTGVTVTGVTVTGGTVTGAGTVGCDDTTHGNNGDQSPSPHTPLQPQPQLQLQAFQPVLSTTGGHSNTDHIIQITGDYRADTIAEYKRKLKRRARAMQPEQRGSDRWDQPRVHGSRRRRIVREKDLPSAPPEPPPSGYVLFIAQMTTKIRHDRPAAHHDQIMVVKEISKIWKFVLGGAEREYYNEFAREAREEYEQQHEEFRATGAYQPSNVFTRLGSGDGLGQAHGHGHDHDHADSDSDADADSDSDTNNVNGPWVRIARHEKNALEREISCYDTVKFPPRPEHAHKPSWVTKIEKQNQREKQRKHTREERLKKDREKQMQLLKDASVAKMKRLKEGALW